MGPACGHEGVEEGGGKEWAGTAGGWRWDLLLMQEEIVGRGSYRKFAKGSLLAEVVKRIEIIGELISRGSSGR